MHCVQFNTHAVPTDTVNVAVTVYPASTPSSIESRHSLCVFVTLVPGPDAVAVAVTVAHALSLCNAVTVAVAVAVAYWVAVAVAAAVAVTVSVVAAVAVAAALASGVTVAVASAVAFSVASAFATDFSDDVAVAFEVTALVAVDTASFAPVDVEVANVIADANDVPTLDDVAVAVDVPPSAFANAVASSPDVAVDVAVMLPSAYATLLDVAVAHMLAIAHASSADVAVAVSCDAPTEKHVVSNGVNGTENVAHTIVASVVPCVIVAWGGPTSCRWYLPSFVAANLAVMETGVSNKLIKAKENFMMIDDD
jgi:hypothetical protein